MKTTEEIFRSMSKATDSLFTFQGALEMADKVAKLYAQQVAEDVRQRCSDNVRIDEIFDAYGDSFNLINRDSILNTEIILP